MNWVTLTNRNLKLKPSKKFLLIFSICTLAIAGVVWACSFEDDSSFSVFSPEAFVSKEYTPFFYDSEYWYYGKNVEIEDNNNRFNDQIVSEWADYLNHQLSKPTLQYLLLNAGKGGIDSVYDYVNGKINILKPDSLRINKGSLDRKKINNLFNYLALAKDCEKFAVSQDHGWYDTPKPPPYVSPALETSLSSELNKSKDTFIRQRLWFQLVRYYFFNDDTTTDKKEPLSTNAKIFVVFDKYKTEFPKNLTYYRTLGYVAGYYRRRGNYAQANYLYSKCYDFSFEMKIPSKFSFHAQQESDWQETIKLAKNKEEKITLWHMLGMEFDESRAIKEIAALNPKSDKIDLLLSRLINGWENANSYSDYHDHLRDTTAKVFNQDMRLVDSIALKNNTNKPYYWNISAGYLHYMHKDYKRAADFYAAAKKQLPQNDKLIVAQYKLLTIWLMVTQLNHIDAKTEIKLIEPLNWLKDLETTNGSVQSLRFSGALAGCSSMISNIYKHQRDTLKATCFNDTLISYSSKAWVQKLVDLMNKSDKSAFEKIMLRYYPHSLDDLYYHQATLLAYHEDIDNAILLLNKITKLSTDPLPANPFNSRLNDCHDCDQAAPQKQKFTQLTFLKTIQDINAELKAGKNVYRNAWLLANAYYNITYYGNDRQFYQSDIFSGADINSQKNAEKYYLLARKYAQNNEQRARCTFMASKCERNEYYNKSYASGASIYDYLNTPPGGKYFGELKGKYNQTKYYQEVLQECGYFKDFINPKKQVK